MSERVPLPSTMTGQSINRYALERGDAIEEVPTNMERSHMTYS